MPTEGGPSCAELTHCLSLISEKLDVIGVGVVEYFGNQRKQISRIFEDGGLISTNS